VDKLEHEFEMQKLVWKIRDQFPKDMRVPEPLQIVRLDEMSESLSGKSSFNIPQAVQGKFYGAIEMELVPDLSKDMK
jgi:hypothetical protein